MTNLTLLHTTDHECELKLSYKLPIDRMIEGKMVVIPNICTIFELTNIFT